LSAKKVCFHFAETPLILYKDTKFQSRLQVFSKILFYLHTSEHHLHISKRTEKQDVTTPVQMFTFFQKKVFPIKMRAAQLSRTLLLFM
jgi:hypothetical protein